MSSPLDMSVYASPPDTGAVRPLPPAVPHAFLSTLSGSEPIEFESSGRVHNFNLQLAGAPLVSVAGRRARVVAPGHVSLNVAHEPFRCVVWPGSPLLTLHVMLPPDWFACVGEQEGAAGGELRAMMATWDDGLRAVGEGVADSLLAAEPDRLLTEELTRGLAVELLRSCGQLPAVPPSGALSAARLRHVLDYLHANIGDSIGLDALAVVAGLSPYHFARSFKSAVGIPPHRYLTELRMSRARTLLLTTTRSVTDIALSLGFGTPSHFTNAFRAGHGVTPSAFRRRCS